jgi:hypothetical protein
MRTVTGRICPRRIRDDRLSWLHAEPAAGRVPVNPSASLPRSSQIAGRRGRAIITWPDCRPIINIFAQHVFARGDVDWLAQQWPRTLTTDPLALINAPRPGVHVVGWRGWCHRRVAGRPKRRGAEPTSSPNTCWLRVRWMARGRQRHSPRCGRGRAGQPGHRV